jgi:hypothetical protein
MTVPREPTLQHPASKAAATGDGTRPPNVLNVPSGAAERSPRAAHKISLVGTATYCA